MSLEFRHPERTVSAGAPGTLNNYIHPRSHVVMKNAPVGVRVKFTLAGPTHQPIAPQTAGNTPAAGDGPTEPDGVCPLLASLPPIAPVVARGESLVSDYLCTDPQLSLAVLSRCAATVFVRERPPVRHTAAINAGVVLLLPRSMETCPWLLPAI